MFGQKHYPLLWKAGVVLGVAAGAVGFSASRASAAASPFTQPVQLSSLLPGGQNSGGIIIGDKVFSDFGYLGNSPPAANIWVGSVNSATPNTEGLIFSGSWQSTNGVNDDGTISYAVHTLSGAPTIHSIGLDFNGTAVGTGAAATVTESVFQAVKNPDGSYSRGTELTGTTVSQTPENSPISVYNDGLNASYDKTQNSFILSQNQSAVFLMKDIHLFSQPGNSGAAIASWVDNTVTQVVPEPASMGLLAIGCLAALARRRKA